MLTTLQRACSIRPVLQRYDTINGSLPQRRLPTATLLPSIPPKPPRIQRRRPRAAAYPPLAQAFVEVEKETGQDRSYQSHHDPSSQPDYGDMSLDV